MRINQTHKHELYNVFHLYSRCEQLLDTVWSPNTQTQRWAQVSFNIKRNRLNYVKCESVMYQECKILM